MIPRTDTETDQRIEQHTLTTTTGANIDNPKIATDKQHKRRQTLTSYDQAQAQALVASTLGTQTGNYSDLLKQ